MTGTLKPFLVALSLCCILGAALAASAAAVADVTPDETVTPDAGKAHPESYGPQHMGPISYPQLPNSYPAQYPHDTYPAPYEYPPNEYPQPLPFPENEVSWGGSIDVEPLPPLPPFPPGPEPPFPPGPNPGPPPTPPPRPPPGPTPPPPNPTPPTPPPGPTCIGCPSGSSCSLCPIGYWSAGNTADTTASNTPCTRCPTGQTTSAPGAQSQQECIPAAAFRGDAAARHTPSSSSSHLTIRDKDFWRRLGMGPDPQSTLSPVHTLSQASAQSADADYQPKTMQAGASAQAADEVHSSAEAPVAGAADSLPSEALSVDMHGGRPWGEKRRWGAAPSPNTALPRDQLNAPAAVEQSSCWCPPGRRCLACAIGTYSAGNPSDVNMEATTCTACPTGSTTSAVGGKTVFDCNVCLPGRAGQGCQLCGAGTWSMGGDAATSTCTPCGNGQTTPAPGATGPDMCFAPACAALGQELTTVPATFTGSQVITGNLQPVYKVLPSLCPAFGTIQPLPQGAAFFFIEPTTTARTFTLTTCVPAQNAAFVLQSYVSSADCSQLAPDSNAGGQICPDISSSLCSAGSTQVGNTLTAAIPAGQKQVAVLACRSQPPGGTCSAGMPYALQISLA